MDFANAFIDLTQPPGQLWENIHPHHRRKINHAEKEAYSVTRTQNIDLLLDLLSLTYKNQAVTGPNLGFVASFYKTVADQGCARIYVANKEGRPVSAALVTLFGPVAYYAYGGSERGNDGASHLLHWNIIRSLAEEKYRVYYLGQVAVEGDDQDEKFVRGISLFKRRFGTQEVVNSRKTFIFRPYSYHLWKMITTFTRVR